MQVRVFFCEPAGFRRSLRRYVASDVERCASAFGYHNASAVLDEIAEPCVSGEGLWPGDDPRWPVACAACGRAFTADDPKQLFCDALYRRADTGAIATWNEMPIGAVRNDEYLATRPHWQGPDGRVLVCKVPAPERSGGKTDWIIDSRASNCTMPEEWTHRCWVRHGKPEDGTLHVDKNGNTCGAGGGSIVTPGWHGFLHGGVLSESG